MNELINEMENYASEYNIPIIQKEGIDFLEAYIKENNVKSILELGSAIGYSAIKMASINSDIEVVTVERDLARYEVAQDNIKQANLASRIEIYHADALEFEIDKQFDLIFIDAAKAQYIKFFERFEGNLNPNGVIVSDNLKFHGMVDSTKRIANRNTRQLVQKIRKYIDYLKDNDNFDTTFYEVGDGIAISVKKNRI